MHGVLLQEDQEYAVGTRTARQQGRKGYLIQKTALLGDFRQGAFIHRYNVCMQVVQAGGRELLLLELEPEVVGNVVGQVGFECEILDGPRSLTLELVARDRQSPLLLFDAADPMNLGWFKRCQFYVDGTTGRVLQTPLLLGNLYRDGVLQRHGVRVQIAKELPVNFRFPGRQPVNERLVYGVTNDLLHALMHIGVGLCGRAVVKPLTGRPRNL